MNLHIYQNDKEFAKDVSEWIIQTISETLKTQEKFTWVLSGGNTPKPVYELLSATPYRELIDWKKIHFFWGDERAVPFADNRNNAKMAYETLLNNVPVSADQIHVMRTDISPEQSAIEYEKILREYFPITIENSKLKTFDLVLLGMGEDGHTLSLFPGTEVVHEENAWTKAFFLKAQDMYRITLTKTIVNRSSKIAFLTTGENKADALHEVIEGKYNPDLYPSQVIKPVNGELHWFVDSDAAIELE
jgi:6-phosphogluconolactonase